jgi:hypothetical protein
VLLKTRVYKLSKQFNKVDGIMNENHKSEKSEKTKKDNRLPIIVLLVVLVLIGLVAILHSNSKKEPSKSTTSSNASAPNIAANAKLYLKPSSDSVAAGGTMTFEVWVDTGGNPVNAVQANLTYPADKYDFGSIDSKGSAFEVQAMSTGGNGKINIARGHIGDVKGPALVAKVNLVAKTSKGDAVVSFAEGSAVVRSTDHKDILKDKTGGSFKVSMGASPVAQKQLTNVG